MPPMGPRRWGVVQRLHVELLQGRPGKGRDGDGHVLQIFGTAGRRDHDLLDVRAARGRWRTRVPRECGIRLCPAARGRGEPQRDGDRRRKSLPTAFLVKMTHPTLPILLGATRCAQKIIWA
jgi:hypothetical protein